MRAEAGPVDARVVRTRRDVLSAALRLLADEGWGAVTHQRLAQVAGYSRATVHKHWPTRADLLRDALGQLGELGHRVPTGDLRADLLAELAALRAAMTEQRLDRALAVVGELAAASAEMAALRDGLVADVERVLREVLAPLLSGPALEAATRMLAGTLVHSAFLHGRPPDDALVGAAVDLLVRALPAG